MTESEWLACVDPQRMLTYLHGIVSDRKLRLFGCAFCRSVWNWISEDCFRNAVEVAERFADGQATTRELTEAKRESGAAFERSGLQGVTGKPQKAKGCAWSTTRSAGSAAMYPLWVFTTPDEKERQLSLLRDIFGNPFRPSVLSSAWITPQVQNLAHNIYEDRKFDRLPDLADALEEGGCHETEILDHCRHPGPHVRGCWVVDLLLGKE